MPWLDMSLRIGICRVDRFVLSVMQIEILGTEECHGKKHQIFTFIQHSKANRTKQPNMRLRSHSSTVKVHRILNIKLAWIGR